MGNIKTKLQLQLNEGRKARNETVVRTIQMILSDLQYLALDKRTDLSDADEIAALRKMVKQREEAVALYRQGNRPELAEKELAEIELIGAHLPRTPSTAELKDMLRPLLAANPGQPAGRLMKEAMQIVSGLADGRVVKTILEELAAQG